MATRPDAPAHAGDGRGRPERRVAVTGLGMVVPPGMDAETVWANLVEGVCAVGPITRFDASGFPTTIAAEVRGFEPADFVDRRTAHKLDRSAQFALAASRLALADAELDPAAVCPDELGVYLGTCAGGIGTVEANHGALLSGGVPGMTSTSVPMMLPNTAAGLVAIHCAAGGPTMALASACAGGANAIGEAAGQIARGGAEVMLAGGADACVTPYMIGGFCALNVLSERNAEPDRAARPFDRDRDGFVMGEGAVVLVLEEMDAARRRGARLLAEVAGYAATCDGFHLTSPRPDGEGTARSLRLALARAGLAADDVRYVSAHAAGTGPGDLAEAAGLRAAFGDALDRVVVGSTKGMHGHLMSASGAMGAAVCILAMRHGTIPPTLNLDHPDPECRLPRATNRPVRERVDVAAVSSVGFGGHNVALVLRRCGGD